MKYTLYLLILVSTTGLFASNSASGRQKCISLRESKKTTALNQNKGCARGKAEPIVKKAVYPNTTFVLQTDSLTAIETVIFDNGDKLIIRNWGCEYYVLTFRFETSRFHENTTNFAYWFKTADSLMRGIDGGIKDGFSKVLEKGLSKLNSYVAKDQLNKYKNLKPGEQINFSENEIPSFVSLDRVEKQTDKKYAVEISFAIGL